MNVERFDIDLVVYGIVMNRYQIVETYVIFGGYHTSRQSEVYPRTTYLNNNEGKRSSLLMC